MQVVQLRARRIELLPCWWGLLGLLASLLPVHATPYAAGITNSGSIISFTLNEAADDVTVILNPGGAQIPFGSRPASSTNSFNKGAATFYEIVVQKRAGLGWRKGVTNQLSSDTNALMQFVNQRGVCVNRNPLSPNFGRIYVSVSLPGTNSGRVIDEGIYMLDPDLTDVAGTGVKNGGLDFAEPDNNAESPFRPSVGPDDTLYICDFSTSTGTLYATAPDVTQGRNVFGLRIGGPFPVTTNRIRGTISAAHIEGSTSSSNLTIWVVDEDLQTDRMSSVQNQRNSVWRWDLGGEAFPASNTPPVRLLASPLINFAPQLADLARGPDGKFYVSQRRGPALGAPGATTAGLFVLSSDGSSNMWDSLTASRTVLQNPSATDILTDTGAIDVSFDGKYIAVLRTNNSSIHVVPLVNGIPDLTNRILLVTSPTNGPAEDIAFDAANNIYYVSSGQRLLRVFTPGGYTRATTRSDGTFEIVMGDFSILSISNLTSEVQIEFLFSAGGQPGDFSVDSTTSLSPPAWTPETGATVVALAAGRYRATVPVNGTRFYRIRR